MQSFERSVDGGAASATGLVAIVDDDPVARRLMRHWIEAAGYSTLEFDSGKSVLSSAAARTFGAVCLDLGLGDVSGLDVLQHLRARDPQAAVVVATAQGDVDAAVQAMRLGASDYLVKPLDRGRLERSLRVAIDRRALLVGLASAPVEASARTTLRSLIGESAPMRELARHVARVVGSDVSVCLLGESGTGKEVVARAIHDEGPRASKPFIAVNCAAIPAALQESDLFGHEKGAFTGATGTHKGRFEQAHGGTLFLDEVGEMSPATQAALLRTLQEHSIRRVGGTSDIRVDVRIISATNRDLTAEVRAGRFREDLFFRLVVYPMHLAPLRERTQDVPLLVAHFIRKLNETLARPVRSVTPAAFDALTRHSWPGNVRELQNVIHYAVLACDDDGVIHLAHLPPSVVRDALPKLPSDRPPPMPGVDADESAVVPLSELERRAIQKALRAAAGNVGRAALMLGMGRATLYRRLADLGISASDG